MARKTRIQCSSQTSQDVLNPSRRRGQNYQFPCSNLSTCRDCSQIVLSSLRGELVTAPVKELPLPRYLIGSHYPWATQSQAVTTAGLRSCYKALQQGFPSLCVGRILRLPSVRNPPPDRGKELPGFVSKSLETDNASRMAKHLVRMCFVIWVSFNTHTQKKSYLNSENPEISKNSSGHQKSQGAKLQVQWQSLGLAAAKLTKQMLRWQIAIIPLRANGRGNHPVLLHLLSWGYASSIGSFCLNSTSEERSSISQYPCVFLRSINRTARSSERCRLLLLTSGGFDAPGCTSTFWTLKLN